MLLFLLICQWRVCKIVCNFQHYFGGRSKRESSCLEIRSSARFLREIWISYFARRILEGVFVGGIVNIRNECLFFSVHGKWIAVRNKQIAWTAIFFSRFMGNESQCGTNKSHETRFAVHAICLFRTAIHFPWTEKKRHSFIKKITFSIYTCIYISFTCLLGKIKSDYFKNKKGGGTRGFVPLLLDRTSAQISLNIWSYK